MIITGKFPALRLRRNRKFEWTRRLIQESSLSTSDLILPVFLIDGRNKNQSIKSMPGVHRYTIDRLGKVVDRALSQKIPMVALFPSTNSKLKNKLGLFCNVDPTHVFESPDVASIYEIPIVLNEQKFDSLVTKALGLKKIRKHQKLDYLKEAITRFKNPTKQVTIAICGKYNGLHDAYKSILEAFIHSGIKNKAKVNVRWIDTEDLEKNINDIDNIFSDVDGILIPGGFGDRGIEGKISASKYARENKIPFLGICLGLQCAVIDFARHVSKLSNANSTEFKRRLKFPVIDLMPKQKKIKNKGATMRLGSYSCRLVKGSLAHKAYNESSPRRTSDPLVFLIQLTKVCL